MYLMLIYFLGVRTCISAFICVSKPATGHVQRPEVNANCHSSKAIHLLFKTGSLTGLPTKRVWLVSRPEGSPHLCLPSRVLGSCLRSSCSRAKDSTAWASFPALLFFMIWKTRVHVVLLPFFYSVAGLGCMYNTTGSPGK